MINAYTNQIMRICYLKGIRDFEELHIILKESLTDIIRKYVEYKAC